MRKLFFIVSSIILVSVFFSCKKEEDPTNDNPDVYSNTVDTTLKSFYLKPTPSSTFENIYYWDFSTPPLSIYCGFAINIYWYDPAASHGIYLHFNNSIGDVLLDANGFVKGFNSGITIDSTLTGSWSSLTDGILSLDYVINPSANKGNLAGQGDKYIVFRAFDEVMPQLKYYGWLRVNVSANGREVKVLSIGFQKNPNTSLKTGEL